MTNRLMAGVLVAVLALGACGDDDDDTAGDRTTSSAADTSSTTTASATAPDGATLVDPAETARAWIAAIADGDDDAAIALTSERSLEKVGGREGYRDMAIPLAEGWGSWGSTEEPVEVTAIELPGGAVAVVVLHGEVALEGPPEEAWAAVPVVATGDGDRVEPFLDLGNVEVDPPGNTRIEPSPTLTAYVLGGRDVWFVVDDGEPVVPSLEGFDGDQQKATLDVGPLAPGLHSLAVVLRNDEGVMVRTFAYSVEG